MIKGFLTESFPLSTGGSDPLKVDLFTPYDNEMAKPKQQKPD